MHLLHVTRAVSDCIPQIITRMNDRDARGGEITVTNTYGEKDRHIEIEVNYPHLNMKRPQIFKITVERTQ